MFKKYSLNEKYFEKIDSQDKAYFLGFLYADGYNFNKGKSKYISIRLQPQDIDVLEKFQKFVESNYKIITIKYYQTRDKKHRECCSLQLNSKQISNDLALLGCGQNKSKTLTFPNKQILPKKFVSHFIRGLFDGDGSVWEGKKKVMSVKDDYHNDGRRRNKIVHNVKFSFTGTTNIIKKLRYIFVKELGFNEVKINTSKNIDNCVQLEYSGKRQMEKFYNFIYKDAIVFMDRKKEKFDSIIKE